MVTYFSSPNILRDKTTLFNLIETEVEAIVSNKGLTKIEKSLLKNLFFKKACTHYMCEHSDFMKWLNHKVLNTPQALFEQLQHLAVKYARRFHNPEVIGYEYEDVLQEFRKKLYTTILTYLKNSQTSTLTPINVYVKCALNNTLKEFVELSERAKSVFKQVDNADFGTHNPNEVFSDVNNFIVNGFDLTRGLKGLERKVFESFLKGSTTADLKRFYGKRIDVSTVISKQKAYIRKNKELLCVENISEYSINFQSEE